MEKIKKTAGNIGMKEKVRKKKDETKSERNSETLRIQTGGNTDKKKCTRGEGIFPLCKNMLHILPVQADPVREPSAGGQGGQPVRR